MPSRDSRLLQTLLHDALAVGPHAMPYVASHQFRAWATGRAVLETHDSRFDLDRYAKAGRCSVTRNTAPTPRIDTRWDGEERRAEEALVDGHVSVTWEGHTIDVLRVTAQRDWDGITYTWLAGESDALLRRLFETVCAFDGDLSGTMLVFANGCWNRSKRLFAEVRGSRFADLILAPEIESRLRSDFREFLGAKEQYARWGVPWKRGALFVGPPGNGKTGVIKALVNELAIDTLYVQSFRGERGHSDERNVRTVFALAREIAPCVMVLEDLDALVRPEARSAFLNELDGFALNEGIVTVASTNHPEKLDPAIVDRPSRFDRKYHFPLPDAVLRERYLAGWSARFVGEARLDDTARRHVASITDGYSFAYLKELVVASLMRFPEAQRDGRTFAEVVITEQQALRSQMSSVDVVPTSPAPELDRDHELYD